MDEHGSLPRAREDGLLVETVGEELLLYDQDSHIAHCLSPIAACVWRHCDGEHDVTELAHLAGVREDLVAEALREMRGKDLLDTEPELMQGTGRRLSRRDAIGRVARYGAAAAAAPLIVSATAATPAMASSVTYICDAQGEPSDTCCLCVDNTICINNLKTKTDCETECTKKGSKIAGFASGGSTCTQ